MISSLRVIGCLIAGAIGLSACGGEGPLPPDPGPESTAAAESALLGLPSDTQNRYLVHLISRFDWRVAADPNAPIEHAQELCAGMIVGPRAILTDNHCIEGRFNWSKGVDGDGHPDGTPMVKTAHLELEVWMHDPWGNKRRIADLAPTSISSPYYGEQVLAKQDLAVVVLPDDQAMKLDRECQFQTQRLCARLPTWTTGFKGSLINNVGAAGQVSADASNVNHIVLTTGQTWMTPDRFMQKYPFAPVGDGPDWSWANYYTLPDKGHEADCGGGPYQQSGVFKDLLGVYRGAPNYLSNHVPSCVNCTGQVGYGTSFADPDVQSWVASVVAGTALVAPYDDGYFDGDPAPPNATAPGFFACCGDGVCDTTRGESVARCPGDCPPQRCEDIPEFEGPLTYADGSPGYCRAGGYNLAYKIDGADDHWAGGLNQPAYNWTSNDLTPVSAQLRFAGKFEWPAPNNDRSPFLSSFNEILLKSVGEHAFDMEFIRQWEFGWHAFKLNSLTELFAPLGSCGACIRVAYPVGTLEDYNGVFGTNVPAGTCERAGVWHEQIWISGGHLAFGAGAHSPCNDWATDRVGLGFLYEGPPYAGVRGGSVPTEAKFVYVFARDRRYLPAAPLCPERPSVSEDDPILMPIDPIPVPPGKIPLPGTDPPPSDMPK